MPASVLDMSMSLDGFIAGPNEGPGNGLGDGGDRLHDWAAPALRGGRLEGADAEVFEELLSTCAIVAGRQTVELADGATSITMTAPRSSSTAVGHPASTSVLGRWSPT